jgi:hypothetical protein
MATLAYRPFLDPLELHAYWYLLLLPMALFLSLAYKAVRVEDLRDLPKQVLAMSAQIVLGMVALGFATYLFVQYVAPAIVPK